MQLRILLATWIVCLPALAYAGDNVECFTAPAAWNVPRGAAVFSRSADGGPVGSVIDTINEHFTHSAVSHGPDGQGVIWGSMSTMKEPRVFPSGNSSCGHPIEPGDLASGWPGSRTDDGGGVWAYYFSNGSFMNGQQDLRFILPSSGTADLTHAICMTDWYKNTTPGCSGNCVNGLGYSVYGYMNSNGYTGATMCSTNISYMYFWGKDGSGNYCTPDAVRSYVYPNSIIVPAANSLYNAVYNQCSGQMGFWSTIGSCLGCFDCNLCDEAADQTVNCFAYPQGTSCTKADHDWAGNGVSGLSATSISPARMAGDYGQYTSDNNSPYKPYGYSTVYFNSGGAVYGCWY